MPMLLIKGTFRLKGTQPDGDTVHFVADDPEEWKLVRAKNPVQVAGGGEVKLRFEGVDALETHYHGEHQPLPLGRAAAAELLTWLGFNQVLRDHDETVTASTPESTPGYILTQGTDIYHRVVALVGRGSPPMPSGTDVTVDVPLLRQTANHHLAARGLVYPTFYRTLFRDLRLELTAAAEQARTAQQGLWPKDVSTTGFKITALSTITADVVILPKLFRRLVDHLHLGLSVSCFPAYLAGKEDKVTVLSTGERFVGLQHVVSVSNGDTVRLLHPVEDLLFDEA
ncbi:thermonuclease family protein [Streptomyces tricolor]|uniref:thermonuclease family protein n=1 Tax=Streptomyces tricolor TaxID=68277 RepID=UPI003805F802